MTSDSPVKPDPACEERGPHTQLLASGDYSLMITAAGGGYSRWRDVALTRWREDPTCDAYGCFVYLKDVANGQIWSAGYQPVGREPERYEVSFGEDRAQIVRADGPILTTTEILISPEDDAEVRRVLLTNSGRSTREIELTSYAEVALANPAADAAHPAFSKMFVQTEFVADEGGTLLATRRPREPGEMPLWMFHVCVLEGEGVGALQFETDRARFLGRGADARTAGSIVDARPLSDTAGTVLDPVLALRRRARIPPGGTARIDFWMGVAGSRAQALAAAGKYRDRAAFQRIRSAAATQAVEELRELDLEPGEALRFQRIAGHILYADRSLRAPVEVLAQNQSGPALLWACGISGDLPIVLARIGARTDLPLVERLLRAHAYWRRKRLPVDLVILNDAPPPTADELKLAVEACIKAACARSLDGEMRGGVFSLLSDALPSGASEALSTAARVMLRGGSEPFHELARLRTPERRPRRRLANKEAASSDVMRNAPPLEFFNGFGGFAASGREYVTLLKEREWTPAPWSNVIANPEFGFLVSADGAGSTWSLNAQQNQITPWSNDPVSNAPAEVVYIRDQDSAAICGARHLCRSESPNRPSSSPTVSATRASRAPLAASRSSSCSSCHSPIRSRCRVSRSQTVPSARVRLRSRTTSNGCSAISAAARHPISSPKSIPRLKRSSRAIPGAWIFPRASRSWTWAGDSSPARAIARNYWEGMDRSPSPRRCSGRLH